MQVPLGRTPLGECEILLGRHVLPTEFAVNESALFD
jgi:hypothetical protein